MTDDRPSAGRNPNVHCLAFPLSMVHAGERVRVQSISGKDETRRFIRNLGFVENADLQVVSETNGNVIVNIKGTRVAVSKAMARRVMIV